MAGLLTGSSFPMPSRVLVMWSQAVAIGTYRKFYRSFTAAGLSGIYTRFPFNPDRGHLFGTDSGTKIMKIGIITALSSFKNQK